EVFAAAYDARGNVLAAPCARPLGPEAFALVPPPPGGRLVVVGEIAAGIALPPGLVRARQGAALDLPDAAWIARIAASRLGTAGSGDEIEPQYVRPPDAVPAHAASNPLPRSG